MTRLVALRVPSTPAALDGVRAVWEAGDAVLPVAPDAPPAEVDRLLAALRPDRLLDADGEPEREPSAPLPTPDGTALVIATSGSTGAPKGVVLSHAALAASVTTSVRRLGCPPGARWRVPLPLHHVAGLLAALRSWQLGTAPDVVDPGDVEALRAAGADHVALVPTQLHRWLAAGIGDGPRSVLLGGAAAAPDLLTRAAAAGLTVATSYGMTETCGGCVYDGVPLDGVEAAIARDGRIRLRGPVLLTGLRGAPDPDRRAGPGPDGSAPVDLDGWFTTGDLGEIGPDGRLVVLGRADDVVVSGGGNVPLPAVVAALSSHPGVAEAAAVGVPDPEWGEVVRAVVVPADPSRPPTLAELRDHVRAHAPRWYAPRQLAIVRALPRDGMGKLTRTALRALPTTDAT